MKYKELYMQHFFLPLLPLSRKGVENMNSNLGFRVKDVAEC